MLHKGFNISTSSTFHTNYRPIEFVLVFLTLLLTPCFIFDATEGNTLFIIHLLVTLCIFAIIIYYLIQSIPIYNKERGGMDRKNMHSTSDELPCDNEEKIDYQSKHSVYSFVIRSTFCCKLCTFVYL